MFSRIWPPIRHFLSMIIPLSSIIIHDDPLKITKTYYEHQHAWTKTYYDDYEHQHTSETIASYIIPLSSLIRGNIRTGICRGEPRGISPGATVATWRNKRWKPWENHGKTIGKPWENHRKIIGKPWENHGKTMGKWWFHGKTIGKPLENTGLMMFNGIWCHSMGWLMVTLW